MSTRETNNETEISASKNTDTIKKLEHSLDVRTLQINRLQKHRMELKSELNLRWKELTTLRATNRNQERQNMAMEETETIIVNTTTVKDPSDAKLALKHNYQGFKKCQDNRKTKNNPGSRIVSVIKKP